LGFEAILGAFLAGAVLRLVDADAATVHPHSEVKLDAIGYGFLIPVFLVTSRVMFDAKALSRHPRRCCGCRCSSPRCSWSGRCPRCCTARSWVRAVAAGFLQATSLPFIVAAVQIRQHLGARPPPLLPEPPPSC
jgi:Kef-type K+ transport system membrane component KefB